MPPADDPTDWSPNAWLWLTKGYTLGVRDGHTQGYAAAVADLLGDLDWLTTERPSRAIPRDVLEARRTTYPNPPRTAAQIRAHAAASWAEGQAR